MSGIFRGTGGTGDATEAASITGINNTFTSMIGITGGISTPVNIDFDTTDTPVYLEGRVFYDNQHKTLAYYNDESDMTVNIGQEQILRVYNSTGATITKGSVVYINGAQGNRPTIALADASAESTSAHTIGVATHDVEDNSTGYITLNGIVSGLDTSGNTEGAAVWLSTTAGAYTETPPTSPDHLVLIGYVTRVHPTQGALYVHVDNGYELSELHDVLITTPANGHTLSWNSTSGLWVNVDPAAVSVADGDKGDITVSSTGSVWTIDNGVVSTSKLGGDITAAGTALLDDATAADQRTTLGLGTISTQAASNVSITGGSISGITDLAVADGGTGASTAAQAKINLEVVTGATGSARVPAGTEAQRDGTPAAGYFRFNSDVAKFEGYNGTAWGSVGGGATGGGGDEIFIENDQTVTTNYTIPTGRNAMTTGPITINSGVTVTVSAGSKWVVL